MEIPTNRYGMVLIIYPNGEVYVDDSTPYKAVPVPKHGRLIDADKLKDVQQSDADLFKGSSDYGEKCRYDEAINAVANIVNAPTIIPAEEGET
jgi:hypothetical protein